MRNIHRLTFTGLFLAALVALSLLHGSDSNNRNDADKNHCAGIYMYPSYLKLTGLDDSHSRLSSKYHLYLYREQDSNNVNNGIESLNGIPVLFIPGNAGSYKQVRSIAAETYYNRQDGVSFDFFSAHFNEDFTAFHGRTLLDQAEYLNDAIRFILSLYSVKNNEVLPKSVIIVAHSMGGIVSRVMPTLPNYIEGSINTIITLAAPHAAAPATFDGDIMNVYSATDKFWRSAYYDDIDSISDQRLLNTSLISITGGGLDQILPADYTTLQSLIPLSNGFTVYTTTMPQVWTPMDHLSIVWCDQLRKKISQSLYEISDIYSPTKTKPLSSRMSSFRKIYLSGFEDYYLRDLNNFVELNIEKKQFIEKNPDGIYHKLTTNGTFSMISNSYGSIYACNLKDSARFRTVESYNCLKIPLNVIPNSDSVENSVQLSSSSGSIEPHYGIALPPLVLEKYQFIIFENLKETSLRSFSPKRDLNINSNFLKLLFGLNIKVPRGSLVTDLSIQNAWSSLLVYELTSKTCSGSFENNQFSPFIRQYINNPFETKWHLQLDKPKQISIHSVAPYTPFDKKNNLHLEVWKPLNEGLKLKLRINIFKSLQLLALRYRLIIASFPIFIISLTLFIQFNIFFKTSTFIDFEEALNLLSSKTPLIILVLIILSLISSNPVIKFIFHILDPYPSNNPLKLPNSKLNPYFLGLEESFLWTLAPFFYLISITAVCIIYHLLKVCLSKILQIHKLLTYKKNSIKFSKNEELKSKKRIIGSILLAIFVNFHIPYQFAVIICTITQILITIKAYLKYQTSLPLTPTTINSEKPKINPKLNFFNYSLSILILMLWLIPINIPILIVFFHDMIIRWKTPFTSHHNVLAILPIILLISSHVRYEDKFLENVSNNLKSGKSENYKIRKIITYIILIWFSWFSLIYGIRASFYLHYLFNLFSAWLVISKFWNS